MSETERRYRSWRAEIEPELDAKRYVDPDEAGCYCRTHKPGVKRRRLQPALKGRHATKWQSA